MFMFFGRKCPIRVAAIDSPIFKKGQDYVTSCLCWIQVSLEQFQCRLREHLQATSGNYGSLSLSMILR